MNTAIYIIFALLLVVSSITLLLVLMQRPKQEGLGASFGSQMTDQVFGAQTSDVLKKGTVLFGSLFMILCFTLSVLMNARFQDERSKMATATATELAADKVQKESDAKAAQEQLAADMLKDVVAEAQAAPIVEGTPTVPAAPAIEEAPAAPAAPAVEEAPAAPAAPAIEETPVAPAV